MNQTGSINLQRSAGKIGPGRLVLVVGPSGAGKDTLISLARSRCPDDVLFARRVVTREASEFEENDHLSPDEFCGARARGEFALHWEAHGHCYGLPRSIDDAIRQGRTVVANVSRSIIAVARETYAKPVVIEIFAPKEILLQRLVRRARISDGVIQQRLERASSADNPVPDLRIENVGDAAEHVVKFLRIIQDQT